MTDEVGYVSARSARSSPSHETRAPQPAASTSADTVHTNTIEGYFGLFKRGMKGVYQHCAEKHLHRYLAEFDFRYNNRSALGVEDKSRAARIVRGAEGKRLMYRRPDEARPA